MSDHVPTTAEVDAATVRALNLELLELRRRHQTLLDALDIDRGTTIPKRQVRAILKGR